MNFKLPPLRSLFRVCSSTVLLSASVDDIKDDSVGRSTFSAFDNYPRLYSHFNSMSRILSTKLYCELFDHVSSSGYTIDKCIQPGIDNPGTPSDRKPGAVAGDEDCFCTFRPLFDRILSDYCGYTSNACHPDSTWQFGRQLHLPSEVVSARVRISRNISGHSFVTHISRAERKQVESIVRSALLNSVDIVGGGNYQMTTDILTEDSNELRDRIEKMGIGIHRCLQPYWSSCQVSRDWPDGRGIFFISSSAAAGDIAVMVNDRDHLRFTLFIDLENAEVDKSNRLVDFLDRLFEFIRKVEESLKSSSHSGGYGFAWDEHFGYLGSSLDNLGAALKFSVKLKVPNILDDSRLPSIIRSLPVALSEVNRKEGYLIVCNETTLGIDEASIMDQVIGSIETIVKIDRRLAQNKPINDLFDF